MNRSVMSLSGGMDSTALLLRMIAEGDDITCISYDYGQKHLIEIDRARDNISYLRENGHNVEHFVVDLSSAMQSLHSALTSEDIVVPEGHYESEQMKQTVVPNRNAIFSSILYARALSIAISQNCQVRIALVCIVAIMKYIPIADPNSTIHWRRHSLLETGKAIAFLFISHTSLSTRRIFFRTLGNPVPHLG